MLSKKFARAMKKAFHEEIWLLLLPSIIVPAGPQGEAAGGGREGGWRGKEEKKGIDTFKRKVLRWRKL